MNPKSVIVPSTRRSSVFASSVRSGIRSDVHQQMLKLDFELLADILGQAPDWTYLDYDLNDLRADAERATQSQSVRCRACRRSRCR